MLHSPANSTSRDFPMQRSGVFLLAFACLSLSLNGPSAAQYTAASAPGGSSVAADVLMVRIAGPWQSGNQRGFSRLVATGAAGHVALSVEWIGDAGNLVHALPLQPPPGAEHLPLARMRNENGQGESVVYFDTPAGDTFVLTVGAPGDARFGAATN
jgi:hypothetical protein